MSRFNKKKKPAYAIKVSRAVNYLGLGDKTVPDVFCYFYELDIFQPHKTVTIDELAHMFRIHRTTALKLIRTIQQEYKRPALNVITVKDICKYHKMDEESIQEYFFHMEAYEFQQRADKLIHK
ncbi:hypothetical protein FAM09_26035 [Niastella caeni]|uniref:Uncharacterized protein n=1 Tax=Niastella caeni TaxID=2569763 RepID=A0A4S8HDH4_9BACT|nr:hypothetical protein [Niastella caeni]THU32913.1 hypothetical protein FAM09_26035 [Niastella caeni]